MKKMLFTAALLTGLPLSGCTCATVNPGERGVKVTLGEVTPESLAPGFYMASPMTDFHMVSTRQQKVDVKSDCMASDRQHLGIASSVLYHIPDANVVKIFTEFHGEPFEVLVGPRLQEAVKEATHLRTADEILAQRETVKSEVLTAVRAKVGDTVIIDDIMIVDVDVSAELKAAIVAKTVAQQAIATAEMRQKQAVVDAETKREAAKGDADSSVIRAKAEAASIGIRGEALQKNPGVMQLELIEKWDGKSPEIVSGQSGLNILLPSAHKSKSE